MKSIYQMLLLLIFLCGFAEKSFSQTNSQDLDKVLAQLIEVDQANFPEALYLSPILERIADELDAFVFHHNIVCASQRMALLRSMVFIYDHLLFSAYNSAESALTQSGVRSPLYPIRRQKKVRSSREVKKSGNMALGDLLSVLRPMLLRNLNDYIPTTQDMAQNSLVSPDDLNHVEGAEKKRRLAYRIAEWKLFNELANNFQAHISEAYEKALQDPQNPEELLSFKTLSDFRDFIGPLYQRLSPAERFLVDPFIRVIEISFQVGYQKPITLVSALRGFSANN